MTAIHHNRSGAGLPVGWALVAALSFATAANAQRAAYPPEEFAERRARLCERLDGGAVLMFSETMPRYGARFRQDHDFFYLTGYEGRNAVLLLEVDGCKANLYLPHQGDREKFIDGPNWLYAPEKAEGTGFEVDHLAYLPEHLARRRGRLPGEGGKLLWMRLGERDELDLARSEKGLYLGRREQNPWGGQPTEQAHQIATIRSRYPYAELRDLTPHLDRLRMIKTPREIEILRRAGKVSADGIAAAIRATRAGGWEYELEAAAKHVFLQHGAEMEAYPAIVGSGPNGLIWHWVRNDRQLQAGDLVVMDYGASFAYMTMDITRTWPVTGTFDEVQEGAYRAVLEAQKAIIAAMRPGATRRETTAICREIYDRWGFEDKPAHGAGHFVGLSVHDVGDSSLPFEPGMVIAVEPIIEIPERNIHIRIEDTVLITEGEPEILSAAVPKEVDALLALVGSSG